MFLTTNKPPENEQGDVLVYIIAILFVVATLSTQLASQYRLSVTLKDKSRQALDNEIVSTVDSEVDTVLQLGRNTYPIKATLKPKEYELKDFMDNIYINHNTLTITSDSYNDYLNYCIVKDSRIIDYRLDSRTEFVGFPTQEDLPPTKYVAFDTTDYPQHNNLIPADYSKVFSLILNEYEGYYNIVNPKFTGATYADNKINMSIPFAENTQIYLFKTDKLNHAPMLQTTFVGEFKEQLNRLPYILIKFVNGKFSLETNYCSTSYPTNNCATFSGVTVKLNIPTNETCNIITSENLTLNYPMFTEFSFLGSKVNEVISLPKKDTPSYFMLDEGVPNNIKLKYTQYRSVNNQE